MWASAALEGGATTGDEATGDEATPEAAAPDEATRGAAAPISPDPRITLDSRVHEAREAESGVCM